MRRGGGGGGGGEGGEEEVREDTHLAHFFRVGVLAESSDDHLEQLLCRLRLLHQICRRSAAWTDTVRTYDKSGNSGLSEPVPGTMDAALSQTDAHTQEGHKAKDKNGRDVSG